MGDPSARDRAGTARELRHTRRATLAGQLAAFAGAEDVLAEFDAAAAATVFALSNVFVSDLWSAEPFEDSFADPWDSDL